jgi:hypothetical protein
MGSETELLRRLHGQGHAGWFAAEARVTHIIRPEQLEERWIFDRAYRFGFNIRPLLGGAPRLFGVQHIGYWVAAKASLLLPPSPRRLRLRYRDRLLAGFADARLISNRLPA